MNKGRRAKTKKPAQPTVGTLYSKYVYTATNQGPVWYDVANIFYMRLIGVSGPTAAGKTTIGKALIEHFHADTHRFSALLADIAKALALPTDKAALQNLSTILRAKLGEDVLVRGLCEWVTHSTAETIVIEGIRREVDTVLLKAVAEETGRDWNLIYIDVPKDIRFERLAARFKEEGKTPLSREAFDALDIQECELELPRVKERADAVFDNSGDLQTMTDEVLIHLK